LVEAGSQTLPDQRTPLRWRGVQVNQRIVFAPETITAQEVLETRNTELRRVMLERMTHEKFLLEVNAEVLDQDRDTGGVRKLLRVKLEDDEPLVAIWVICPSTDRNYVLRVPPTMRTCRQAAAWIAGFDNPNDYAPIKET
jgi:predicted Rdx family selenoprotein